MRRSILRARRILIVAPHPDDEAIGAWGLMRHFHRAGAVIEVLVVTDGDASHPGSIAWPVERLVVARRRETLGAMRALGLRPPSVRFLGLPDGCLSGTSEHVSRVVRKAVLRGPARDLIVGPDRGDHHADHHAVAEAIASVPRRGERRLSYHVWPEGAAKGARPIRVRLDGPARAMKRRIVRSYRTQAGVITDAPTGFTLNHRHLKAFAGPQERFKLCR